ncbi:MAG: HAMP domain-containing protein [Burkholderiales bacterium]|nr:HAMP domain-containing protein [Burkholderiales bacterium]
MGRLFWKIFAGFWLTLVVTGAGVGALVYAYNQARLAEANEVAAGPRSDMLVSAVATAAAHGGARAVESLIADWGPRRPAVLVVDESGRDVLGRAVPPGALASAREQLGGAARAAGVRQVAAPDGRALVVFAPAPERAARSPRARPRALRPLPDDRLAIQLGIALVASLAFSAGLAWYLARPVRHLRTASRRLADGALDTRVAPVLGGRRDEIADLGRDFDHMAARLQALVGAQKRLLHDVSHELRSPLARLQVAVGLARQQPARLEGALERIERETARLDALVGELLTLSRLEAGVTGAPAEALDVGELLEEIAADARFEAEAAGCRVALRLHGELAVRGRAELLRRALENVIRNAVKYAARDTVVEVAAARDAAELVVSVCDRGPGAPATELDRLFEPFFRAERGPERAGYGLGLAIARRAVEAHGGRIGASNRPGGGLCVEIRLPGGADDATRPREG